METLVVSRPRGSPSPLSIITGLAAQGATPIELQARTAQLIKSGNDMGQQLQAIQDILETGALACEQFAGVVYEAWTILTTDGVWKVTDYIVSH